MNSAPTIVASMLISPIMGPILAMSVSFNLRKGKLFRLGMYNYLLTLLICVTIGFLVRAMHLLSSALVAANAPCGMHAAKCVPHTVCHVPWLTLHLSTLQQCCYTSVA